MGALKLHNKNVPLAFLYSTIPYAESMGIQRGMSGYEWVAIFGKERKEGL